MSCLNLGLSVQHKGKTITVGELLEQLSKVFGSKDIAYAVLSRNNGYPLELTRNGVPSLMHKTFMDITGDVNEAYRLKARTYSRPFINEFGNWVSTNPNQFNVDENGEPLVYNSFGIYHYKGISNLAIPVVSTHDFTSFPPVLDPNDLSEFTQLPAVLGSNIRELLPNITESQLGAIYNNYVALMNVRREGKALAKDAFMESIKDMQVFKYKDTYIFGNYDVVNAVFRTVFNSSPTSKELLSEAIPKISESGLNVISFVPMDYAKKLVRSGYTMSKNSYLYNFRGEKMYKYAVASNPKVFTTLFGTPANKVPSKDIRAYSEKLHSNYRSVHISVDNIKSADNSLNATIEGFLKNFGISVRELTEMQRAMGIDSMGVSSILSKVINADDKTKLPDMAGEFIAYMMQYNPLIRTLINDLEGGKLTDKEYSKLDKTKHFKYLGSLIGKQLRGEEIREVKAQSLIERIIQIIREFFGKVGTDIEFERLNSNIAQIANNILQQNKKVVAPSLFKPGAPNQPVSQISIEDALAKDTFGKSIIKALAKKGFILTGSTALSNQGVILRPNENPLHDIDWVSPFNKEETLDNFLSEYPNSALLRTIENDKYTTISYVTPPSGYTISNLITPEYNGKIVLEAYDVLNSEGKIAGTFRLEKDPLRPYAKAKEMSKGVEAKVIDFFINSPIQYATDTFTTQEGWDIELSNWNDIFRAKLEFARYKDIWDYNRFVPYNEYSAEVSTVSMFMEANGLTNNNFSSTDAFETYRILMDKAQSYGISVVLTQKPGITKFVPKLTAGVVEVGTEFVNLDKTTQTNHLFRSVLEGVLIREAQKLTEEPRKNYINSIRKLHTSMEVDVENLNKVIPYMFNDAEFLARVKEQRLQNYLANNLLSTLGEVSTEGMKNLILSIYGEDVKADVITPVVTDNNSTPSNPLSSQYVEETTGAIEVGSVVKLSPNKTFDAGYTTVVIVRRDKEGIFTGVAMNKEQLLRGKATVFTGKDTSIMQKIGRYGVISDSTLSTIPTKAIVFDNGAILNINKFNDGVEFLNTESYSTKNRYVEMASANANTAKSIQKPTTPLAIKKIADTPVVFNGVSYSNVSDAFTAESAHIGKLSVVSVNGRPIAKVDLILKDILYNVLIQNPSLAVPTVSNVVFSEAGTNEYFNTTPLSNNFITALSRANMEFLTVKHHPVDKTMKFNKVPVKDIASGSVKAITVKSSKDSVLPVSAGNTISILNDDGQSVKVIISSIQTSDGTSTLQINLVDLRNKPKSMGDKMRDAEAVLRDLTSEDDIVLGAMHLAKTYMGEVSVESLESTATIFVKSSSSKATMHGLRVSVGDSAEGVLKVLQGIHLNSKVLKPVSAQEASASSKKFEGVEDYYAFIETIEDIESANAKIKNVVESQVPQIHILENAYLTPGTEQATEDIIAFLKGMNYSEKTIEPGIRTFILDTQTGSPVTEIPTKSAPVAETLKTPSSIEDTLDVTSTELKTGSLVEYNGNSYIYRGLNKSGFAQLIMEDGKLFSGTPLPDKLTVKGAYKTESYNDNLYVIKDADTIYSVSTGKRVFHGNDTTSISARKALLPTTTSINILGAVNINVTEDSIPLTMLPNGNIEVDVTSILAQTFYDLVTSKPSDTFVLDSNKPEVVDFLRRLATLGYPSNLIVTKALKESVTTKEKIDTIKGAGILHIRGVEINLASIDINFDLSEDQIDVLEAFADWMASPTLTPFSIEGAAGTGKTTLLRVARHYAMKKRVVTNFAAMTHMAGINLEMLTRAHSSTLHSLLSLSPDVDDSSNIDLMFDENNISTENVNAPPGSVLFIDEASMASDELSKATIDVLTHIGVKIVFIGSVSQLPPVGSGDNTIVFNPSHVELHVLKQIKRQSDTNPSMMVYTQLAYNQESGYNFIKYIHSNAFYNEQNDEGMKMWGSKGQAKFIAEASERFIEDLRTGEVLNTRILTYTNKDSANYNKAIRDSLGFNSAPVEVGDLLLFNEISGELRKGLTYKVSEVRPIKTALMEGGMPALAYLVNVDPGLNYTINGENALKSDEVVIIPNTVDNKAASAEYAKEVARLRSAVYKLRGNRRKLAVFEYLTAKNKYKFMVDVANPDTGYRAIPTGVTYGYASTVHKSQGSTFNTVFVDESQIRKMIQWNVKQKHMTQIEGYKQYNRMMYVALTRASKLNKVLTGSDKNSGTKEELFNALDELALNSKTFTTPDGTVLKKNSPEHRVKTLYEISGLTSKDKITRISSIKNKNSVENALFEAVPNDIIVTDMANKQLVSHLDRLMADVAIEASDKRVLDITGEQNLTLYNASVYDTYMNKVYRTFITGFSEAQVMDNEDIVLSARGFAVKDTIDKDIAKLRKTEADLESVQAFEVAKNTSMLQSAGKAGGMDAVKVHKNRIVDVKRAIARKLAQSNSIQEKMSIIDLMAIAESDLTFVEDLLKRGEISQEEYVRALRLLKTWMHVGDFSNPETNPYLTKLEAQEGPDGYQVKFREYANRATSLYAKVNSISGALLENTIAAHKGSRVRLSDLLQLRNTLNWFNKLFYSLAEVDNPIIAYVFDIVNKANKKAEIQAISDSKKLADVFEKLEPGLEDLFWQVTKGNNSKGDFADKGGVATGALVSEYSAEYYRSRNSFNNDGMDLAKFRNEHWVLDPSKARDAITNPSSRRELIAEGVAAGFTTQEAERHIDDAAAKYQEYIKTRKDYLNTLFGEGYNVKTFDEVQRKQLDDFNNETHVLYRYMDYMSTGMHLHSHLRARSAEKYLVILPKRKIKGRPDNHHYDENYTIIQNNAAAKAVYDLAVEITRRAKSNFNEDYMSDYALGSVSRDVADEFKSNGLGKVTRQAVGDNMLGAFTSKYATEDREDVITGEPIKSITRSIDTLEDLIYREFMHLKSMKRLDDTAKIPYKERMALYREASANVMARDKKDLFMALNTLNQASLSYAYKNAIQPSIDLAVEHLTSGTGLIAGETRGATGGTVKKSDIENALEMTDYFLNKEFYELGAPDNTWRLPIKKKLTSKEQSQYDKYEAQIQLIESNKVKSEIDNKKIEKFRALQAELGSNTTMGSILNSLISYTRYLSIGWGYQAGLINAMQGQVANMTMAADGKYYDFQDLKGAYGVMLSFSDENKKFQTMIEKYALLGDIMYDFQKMNKFSKNKSFLKKGVEALHPFAPMKYTEKGNQGAVMIAMFKHTKVTDTATGKQLSMWEAIDSEGNLADKYSVGNRVGEDAMIHQIQVTTEYITTIHGDYVSAKMIQDIPLGRAFIMFKMWFFDPFMVRFGKHKYNHVLETETKGRYMTLMEGIISEKGNFAELYRKYQRGEMSEVDMTNFRTALSELFAILSIVLARLMLKWALCEKKGKQEDCGKAQYVINSMKRLENEVRTFTSFKGYSQFISNPLAVTRILDTMSTLGGVMEDLAAGDITFPKAKDRILKTMAKETPLVRRVFMEKKLMEDPLPDFR